jgi:hypothetical protein
MKVNRMKSPFFEAQQITVTREADSPSNGVDYIYAKTNIS